MTAIKTPGPGPYVISALACGVLFALPFVSVTFPPITDLPQQVAQIRLLEQALEGDERYRVHGWHHPNKLSYLVLWACWRISEPLAAGRLATLAIGLLWVAAVHVLAYALRRPAAIAVLAALFFFNYVTYWGFLNFLLGFPAFVAWFLLLLRLDRGPVRGSGPALLAAAALLYSAHILWLGAGLAWLVVVALAARRWRELARRAAWVSPVAVAAAVWYGSYARQTVSSMSWGPPPLRRLDPRWLLDHALGGLRGSLEPAVACAIVALAALGVWQHRRRLRQALSGATAAIPRPVRAAGLLGLLLLLASLILPGYYQHTTAFAGRWLPPAAVFLLLACPPSRLRPPLPGALAWLLAIAFVTSTAAAWREFEDRELAGLEQCLDRLPPEQRLLGLAFIQQSPRLAGFPFHHVYAWAQVHRGAELNRSFAIEPVALVAYRELPKRYPWTDGLDFYPRRFRASDRDFFQYLMIYATPPVHGSFLRDPHLEPVTPDLPWRLYRVSSFGGG